MASRFEYHVIAKAVEVVSVIDGREHRVRGSGRWNHRTRSIQARR